MIYFSKKIFILIFFFVTFNNNLYSYENKIILKIENEIITSVDLDNEISYLAALNPKIKKLSDNEQINIAKNSIVREKIKKIEILKYTNDLKINEDLLENIIKSRYKKLNFEKKDDFLKYLETYNINIETLREKIAIEIIWNELIYSKFSKKIKINENEIKEKIKKLSSEKIKSYDLSEIVFTISNKNELIKKFNEIKKSISEDGFENSASKFSISNSSQIGGKLGWIKEASLNKKIISELKSLEKNSISKPIFTPNGYLVLKINDIRFTNKKYDEKLELKNIINYERNLQLNQHSKNYFNKLKKNVSINEN